MPKVPKIWKVKLPIKQLSRLSRISQFSLSHPSQHPESLQTIYYAIAWFYRFQSNSNGADDLDTKYSMYPCKQRSSGYKISAAL